MKISITLTSFFITLLSFSQTNNSCSTINPICTNGQTYTANSGVTAASVIDPGNNYGCLSTSPNPSWFYITIIQDGNLDFSLSAPSDIDFIIWGPFNSQTEIIDNCDNYGDGANGSNILDCSFSGTNNETPSIPNAIAGEIYVLLITNYANNVQDITFSQTAGTGLADCSGSTNTCTTSIGTFNITKNGTPTNSPIYLCGNDNFSLQSNNDYILPEDIIQSPIGDGIYSAQLMWLVYNALPVNLNPNLDPGFTGQILSDSYLNGTNSISDPLFQSLGINCGTYYFVPVTGDDGVGGNNNIANGINDNGSLHWDKNNNGCYSLGTAIEVTFACPISLTSTPSCGPNSSIELQFSGSEYPYNVINQSNGTLSSTTLNMGDVLSINNLNNNQTWDVLITNSYGCNTGFNGIISVPTILTSTITNATSCSGTSFGNLEITLGTTGVAPFTVLMNSTDVSTTAPNYNLDAIAGTLIEITVIDNAGCETVGTPTTIGSTGHNIAISTLNLDTISCFGSNDGAATILANPLDASGNNDGNITTINWTSPLGTSINGNYSNTTQTNLSPGLWIVSVSDDLGCTINYPVTIEEPYQLILSIDNFSNIACYGDDNGSIEISGYGGSGNIIYNWSTNNPTLINQNNLHATDLIAGDYVIQVLDENYCSTYQTVSISQPNEMTASLILNHVNCFNDSNGSVTINSITNANGPLSSYEYLWDLNDLPVPSLTYQSANNLIPDLYSVTITDAFNCSFTQSFEIVYSDSIYFSELTASNCTDGSNGYLFAEANSNTGNTISYEWLNLVTNLFTTTNEWENVSSGDYQITAFNLDCSITETLSIGCVDINEESFKQTIKVFPTLINNNELNVELNLTSQHTLYIYDALGKIVYVKIIENKITSFGLDLDSGHYYYSIISDNISKSNGKIIIIN